MGSLLILLLIFGLYLWFILVAGPRWMEKREPYDVTTTVRIYNIFQVIVCTTFVVQTYKLGFTVKYIFQCERFEFLRDDARLEIIGGSWLFLCLRTFELVETVFFILRKKFNQASFLHIFHHIGSALMTWLFISSKAGKIN